MGSAGMGTNQSPTHLHTLLVLQTFIGYIMNVKGGILPEFGSQLVSDKIQPIRDGLLFTMEQYDNFVLVPGIEPIYGTYVVTFPGG